MTLRYLLRGSTVTIDSNGTGNATLTPDGNQFWIPRLLRVGIMYPAISQFGLPQVVQSPLSCTLFHGGSNDFTADAFVDATANGIGDVTGILNGTLIQPGEYITARWRPFDATSNLFPAPTEGYLSVLGLATDTLSEATAALATAVPGPGFLSELQSPMRIPPAPAFGVRNTFMNPGQNNVVQLHVTNGIDYLYSIEAVPYQTGVAGAEGYFSPNGVTTMQIGFINPFAYAGPVYLQFHGMQMPPANPTAGSGVQFVQSGNAAINAMSYSVTITFRVLFF